MASNDLSILVVDDAKFSSAVIGKTLKSAGYKDIRIAYSANEALMQLEERPVRLLIADWLMPEMDGLELAARVRQLDEAQNQFTYIILLTAKEGTKVLVNAFDKGVDDFINKSVMSQQLLPRIYAAGRISNMQNRLLQENKLLLDANRKLKKYTTIDPLTGLGNRQYALERLKQYVSNCESRGGVPCYAILSINNFAQLQSQYNKRTLSQLIVGVSRRLRQLVRPIDVVARYSNYQFCIVSGREEIQQVNSHTFRRIHDGVSLKAYKTSSGFISIKTALSVSGTETKYCGKLPSEKLVELAYTNLKDSEASGRICVTYWQDDDI